MRLSRSLSENSALAKRERKVLFRISTDKLVILKERHGALPQSEKNFDVLSG